MKRKRYRTRDAIKTARYRAIYKDTQKYKDMAKVVRERFYRKEKITTFEKYGGCKCYWCGDTDMLALTIDHIDNNGSEHRKKLNISGGHGLYAWLKKNNYPSGYQVLCMGCNWAKKMNKGVLPQNRKDILRKNSFIESIKVYSLTEYASHGSLCT